MTSSPPVLLPSRPSLLDGLAHAALARACAAFRQSGSGESGLPPVLVDATLGNGHDAAFLLTCAPPGSLVLGVDIQPQAVRAATARLEAARQARQDCRVQIFCRAHQELPQIWAGLPPEERQRPLLGGIFNLAVEGLGRYTSAASGIFMMMVCGGGIIPLVQGYVADLASYSASYWVIVVCLAYLLFYAFAGYKNVNKDIITN